MVLSKSKWEKMHRIVFQGKNTVIHTTCEQGSCSLVISWVHSINYCELRPGLIMHMDKMLTNDDDVVSLSLFFFFACHRQQGQLVHWAASGKCELKEE